jgi:hypothetical protein
VSPVLLLGLKGAMSSIGTIPRRLIECGGAVEELGGLWHIARTGAVTYCGDECGDWPRVAHAVERCGIWCGPCLMAAVAALGVEGEQEPGSL